MSTFFTADLHFGHTRIIEFHPDRGDTLDEMHERIIDGWNSVVQSGDDVWVLGDFAMGVLDQSLRFFHRLKGSKHLVAGNHDGNRTKKELSWASIHDYREWRQKPHKAVLSHYPMLTWNGAHHGVWMLHGHSHGLLGPTATTRMDVGIDTHPEFRPYSVDEIAEIMSQREYIPVDAHR
jgi:calcineurin-like phosphoesterase family protein